jgi:hypothetical protein
VVVGKVIFWIGVGLGEVGCVLFVSFGRVKIKLIPLIIPRMYMSRASLREGTFERAGDFCCGCWFGGRADVGFGVVVLFSGIFLLLHFFAKLDIGC